MVNITSTTLTPFQLYKNPFGPIIPLFNLVVIAATAASNRMISGVYSRHPEGCRRIFIASAYRRCAPCYCLPQSCSTNATL